MAHIYAAGLITACVGDAHVFVMNTLVGRHNVHTAWKLAISVVDKLVICENNWWMLHPDVGRLYRDAVKLHFPEWLQQFEAWEEKTKRVQHVDRFLSLCRQPSRSHLIARIASTGKSRWIAKAEANMNKDCSGIPELEHAPVNTDTTESGIGALDYNLYKTLAAFTTTFGVVQAQRMQIFASEGGKLDRQNRRKKAVDHVVKSSKWTLTSFLSFSPETRSKILSIISRYIVKPTPDFYLNGPRFNRTLYHKRLTTHITINTIKGI